MSTNETKTSYLAYTPFTGLGLYNGFRGNRWLRNRIAVFKHFVIPSLLNQSDRNFIHWISWRPEEKRNPYVLELAEWLREIPGYQFVFTFSGVCFWDDKYPDDVARARLANSLHFAMPELFDIVGQADQVIMMLQPSDDLYNRDAIHDFKVKLSDPNGFQAVTYKSGYLMNYSTNEVLEYNPKTNPPFFAYAMPREVFVDPNSHLNFTGPYKSHEYIGEKMRLGVLEGRGFLVGTHGENISTHFNHPFGRDEEGQPLRIEGENLENLLDRFGLRDVEPLHLPLSMRKWLMRKLPHQWQRKLRYWFGERGYARFYNFIRN